MSKLSTLLIVLTISTLPAFAEVEMNHVNLGNYKAHGGGDNGFYL